MAPACQTETEVQHRQVEKLCPDPNAIEPVGMEDQYLNADQYQVESCDQIQENNDLLCPFSISVHEKCKEAPGRQEYRLVDIYQSWMRPTAKGSAPKISKAAVIVHPPIVYFYTFIIHCHGMPCNRNRCSAHTCMRLLRKWRYTPMKKKNSPDDHI